MPALADGGEDAVEGSVVRTDCRHRKSRHVEEGTYHRVQSERPNKRGRAEMQNIKFLRKQLSWFVCKYTFY